MTNHNFVPVEMKTNNSGGDSSLSFVADDEVLFRLNEAGQIVTRKYQVSTTKPDAVDFFASLGLWIVKEASGETVYIPNHAVILVHKGKALK